VIPLSLYVHFPWCVRKCPYCDFNSHEARSTVPEADYLAALIRDLDAAMPGAQGRPVVSVFIGGGTPSLMAPATVAALLDAIRTRLALADDAEVTLEANPGAIEAGKFAAFRAAGVTRLSLGIQSFDDGLLAAVGRIHSADEARRAVALALDHFEQVNIDLMYALPGQTPDQVRRDIETAAAFGPGHLSAYHLTVEPNTAFHRNPPALPDDDLAADMQDLVEAILAEAGYEHYETSAFARPGRQCRHNLNYWTFGDYLGIGAGAHAKISGAGGVVREMRRKHPADYLRADDFVQERHVVSTGELPGEFMMNALRLNAGFAPELFGQRTGLPLATVAAALRGAEADGLLETSAARIAPTPLGQRHLNALIMRFIE
jgi:putative oxygen-independent coproporphyrinogen III oxidase